MDRAIRVLHVDDDPEFADLAAAALERADDAIAVTTATDAAAGLSVFESEPVDCVVSDYEMPGTDGLDFLREVRALDADVPFILFTGKGSEAVASEAVSAGVTDYLRKGGGTDRFTLLANRIRNGVEGARARRQLAARERALRRTYEVIAAEEPLSERVERLIEVGREAVGTGYATFARVEDGTQVFEATAVPADGPDRGEQTPLEHLPPCETVVREGRAVVLRDVEAEAPDLVAPESTMSCHLGAPVSVDGEVYGTVCFYDTEPRPGGFSAWERTYVDLLADWVGAELTRQRTLAPADP